METLKIAIFSWESMHSIRTGGLAVSVTELSEALARLGHEVHLLTRMGDNQKEDERINGVNLHRCTFHGGSNIMEYTENMGKSMVGRFYDLEKEGEFDVLHGHDWHIINALNEIKQNKGYPFALSFHSTEYGRNGGAFGDWWEFQEISGREWYGGLTADRVITVSYTMKNELMYLYNVPDWKIDVIPNGIHPERYQKKVDPGRIKERYGIHPLEPMTLFIGRLVHQKGPDLLVEAIPHVLNYREDAKFIIAGDGGMRSSLEARADELGVADAIRFLGYIPDEEYIEILNACDIVCIPSRNEPFGIVLLEAWAAGKAVVAADIGGLGENITNFENGIKIYHNPHSIAWGINYIINDAQGIRALGEKGLELAKKKFSWDNIAKEMIKTYKEI